MAITKTPTTDSANWRLDKNDDPLRVGDDLNAAIVNLVSLGRSDEIDDFRQSVIDVHKANWRLLWAAADSILYGEHYGYLVAGKFYRGNKRGGGAFVYVAERDRVRALQWMEQAMAAA